MASTTAPARASTDSPEHPNPKLDPGPVLPDRSSPLPLWAQVSADIRRRVTEGAFDTGFPGEIALTEQYEVSRHTVREALRVLRDEGLLRSERGRGTTIDEGSYSQNMGTLYSLFRTIEDQGVPQRSEVRRLSTTVNPSVAAKLQIESTDELVVLERVRFAGDEPLAVDTAWLPKSIAAPLLEADFTTGGLYDALARTCGVRPDAGHEQVSAMATPSHIAEFLHLPDQVAVLYIERTAMANNAPVEWRETYIRGDRFSFEAQWRPGVSTITPTTETR
ncbi:MAG TPA: GntR family transcriptional regulator [Candidatus Nanopelagicales bacterium]|nr:GntR family transcriptional regulator [Candidatus Nanopelagicales bacterium]